MIALAELLALVSQHWPRRLEKGRITHIHANEITLSDGSKAHLRVLVQTVSEPDKGRFDVSE